MQSPTAGSLLLQKRCFFTHNFPSCQECLYTSSSTSSWQLLLTPAACVCRAVLCLAPACFFGLQEQLWWLRQTCCPQVRLLPPQCCWCATYIYMFMIPSLQVSATKKAMQRGGAHSGFYLPSCCCPTKRKGTAISAIPSGGHSCPEMSLPEISPLIFLSCYGSKTHHL